MDRLQGGIIGPVNRCTKLLPQPAEAAFVNAVVEPHLVWEEARSLNAQVKPLDVNLALRAIAGHDEHAEPVDAALELPIGCLAGFHQSNLTRRSQQAMVTFARQPFSSTGR